MPTPAESLIEKINETYNRVLQIWQDIPPAELTRPVLANGWSVKDVIAHLSAWDWRCAAVLSEAHISDAPLKTVPEVNALNREIYEERKDWSWEEVENDFRAAHRALISVICEMPEARLQNSLVQRSILQETCNHYKQHLPELEQWRVQIKSKLALSRS